MNPLKLAVLFLLLMSLGALGMVISLATLPLAEGPVRNQAWNKMDPWLQARPKEHVALFVFVSTLPFALIPGLAGCGIWFFGVRKQSAALERAAATAASRETETQGRLDTVIHSLLARDGSAGPLRDEEVTAWTQGLDWAQKTRLLRLVTAYLPGSAPPRYPVPAVPGETQAGWVVRALAFALTAMGVFGLLLISVDLYIFSTDYRKRLPAIGQEELTAILAGCSGLAFTVLLGGIGLSLLIRGEQRARRLREAERDRAREVCLGSWIRRIAELNEKDDPAVPAGPVRRLLQACIVSALAELDGPRRIGLFARLRDRGVHTLALAGLDLRYAPLAEADLEGLYMPGIDFSNAVLARARMRRSVLQGSRFNGADLREANAEGANLARSDFQGAHLHRCNFSQADLRGANLEGANLWGADLRGADLREARVTPEQLSTARTRETEP